ncbi:hypothetical protein HYT25_00560 [Candidatus Pacearchaeota archaeon]|nr:hypothetical protein [Candidatus Pacearchaeota archaeon]
MGNGYSEMKIRNKKDEFFLIREGVRIAGQRGLEIKFGDEVLVPRNPRGILNLPFYEESVDVRPLIALAGEEHQEIFERYINNSELLNVPGYTA